MSLQYKIYKMVSETSSGNKFQVTKMELLGRGKKCFDTPEEAQKHFNEAYKKAEQKFDKTIEGGLHRIEQEGKYIEFEIDGYNFKFRF